MPIPPDTERGLRRLSRAMATPAVDLDQLAVPLHLFGVVPEEIWRKLKLLPLAQEAGELTVAIDDTSRYSAIDELAFRTGLKIVALVAEEARLAQVFEACLEARRRGEREWRGPRAGRGPGGPSPLKAATVPPDDDGIPLEIVAGTDPPVGPAARLPSDTNARGEVGTFEDGPSFQPESFTASSSSPRSISDVTQKPRARVLVVDDEPVLRQILRQGLGQRGFEVVESSGGHEALKLIKEREPDAVVLDAMLPDLHGFEVVKRLRESRRYHHVPVVMVTGVHKGWRLATDLRLEFGVHAYIEKPFDLHDVVRAVEDALAGRPWVQASAAAEFSPEARRLYGEASSAFRTGDLDTAIAHMASAVAFDPMSAQLRHQLGLLYAQRGHDFSAIQELEAAVDLEPGRFQSLRNLAILYQRRGLRRKASELWERALAHAPDDETRKEIREVLLQLL